MQQQAIIKLEETKENRVMFQIDTLRNLVRTCEKNQKSEEHEYSVEEPINSYFAASYEPTIDI